MLKSNYSSHRLTKLAKDITPYMSVKDEERKGVSK